MKNIRQQLFDGDINTYGVFKNHYNNITEEDMDYIVKNDYWRSAEYFNNHPFFTQKHVDCVLDKDIWVAVEFLSHRLSEENINYISQKRPDLLKGIFK